MISSIQSIATQSGVAPTAQAVTPDPPSKINVVTDGNGIVDVQIVHNDPVFKAISYYVEYSTSPGFTVGTTHVIDLGSSRNIRIPVFMGGTSMYFRAYCQYAGSQPSQPVNFGTPSTPTPVISGGTGPAMQVGQSSGSGDPQKDSGVGSGLQLARNQGEVQPKL